uniref:SH3 domain-containing protein n=1 Tax=Mesocestoides corti TaxID=53468 RepID=A0A5K3FQZ8_MESCO
MGNWNQFARETTKIFNRNRQVARRLVHCPKVHLVFVQLCLRRLCEKALINVKKVIGLETSYGRGYNSFIHAIAKLVDTENLLPVSFNLQANGEMKQSIETEKKNLKQWRQEKDRFQYEAKSQAKIIDEEIRRYHDKYREVIRSKAEYEKMEEDKLCSKLDVERALQMYSQKHSDFKRAHSDYVAALDQFNLNRRYHYGNTLKRWGEAGQALESFRVTKTQEIISVLVERLRVMIDRLLTVCTDLEVAAATMDAEKDSVALIERLRTGNEPPGDIPVMHLEIDDPPSFGVQSNGAHSAPSCRPPNAETPEKSSYCAAIQVSLKTASGCSPFSGADPLVEPTETRRLPTGSAAQFQGTSRSMRRFSVSSVGLGTSGNGNGHSSFLWKMFSRKSKSKESERKFDGPIYGSRVSRSQSERESLARRIEIVHIDHENIRRAPTDSGDVFDSDVDVEGQRSRLALSPSSAPLPMKSECREAAQSNPELSRSLSSPSSDNNGIYESRPRPSRPSPSSFQKSSPLEHYGHGSIRTATNTNTHQSKGAIIGAVPGSHCQRSRTVQKPQRNISPHQTVHQPKRHNCSNYQSRKALTESKLPLRSSASDLIVVGTCKALYDFESSQYGEAFLHFKAGDELKVISSSTRWQGTPDTDGWIYAETIQHDESDQSLPRRGFIPAGFVQLELFAEPAPLSPPRRRKEEPARPTRAPAEGARGEKKFLALGKATEL